MPQKGGGEDGAPSSSRVEDVPPASGKGEDHCKFFFTCLGLRPPHPPIHTRFPPSILERLDCLTDDGQCHRCEVARMELHLSSRVEDVPPASGKGEDHCELM